MYITYCTVVKEGRAMATFTTYRKFEVWTYGFWATVCKTIRPMLSDRRPVCPVLSACHVLSATLVYCGQRVGQIKTKLGKRIGLGPCHIV